MRFDIRTLAIGVLCALAPTAYADPPVSPGANGLHLGNPAYGGTGCPADTVAAALSADGKTLSVFFDDYVAETAPDRLFDRKSCNLAVPVHVPSGYSVSLLGIDYRGFASVPSFGEGRFTVEYFFAGHQGPTRTRVFGPGFDSDYLVKDNLQVSALSWSPCGQDVILRSNSSVWARRKTYSPYETYVALDTADFHGEMLYLLQWKTCTP